MTSFGFTRVLKDHKQLQRKGESRREGLGQLRKKLHWKRKGIHMVLVIFESILCVLCFLLFTTSLYKFVF